jgi:hypothetical protein
MSNEQFPGSCSLHHQSFWLLIFDQIEQVLLPVPCCHLLILNKASAFRKHIVPAKGLCSWHCIISKGLLKFTTCCGGTVTELLKSLPLRDVPCFHFRDKVHKHLLICQAPTPHWGITQPCHCKWGWRKDQDQRLSVLADCSIASTARRKLISLLYCPTLYVQKMGYYEHMSSF